MSRMLRATSALSAVAVAALIAGCANPMNRVQAADGSASNGSKLIGAATRAQLALASGDFAAAIEWAEKAVANSPQDAELRGLLGNAYLGAGRFASAEAAYKDALTLVPGQPGVGMKLALSQIAQGKSGDAVQMLDQLRGSADPADIGLAMALAGQPGNAVAILDEAARRLDADARTRQNLALAHALAGDWQAARVIAAQDVPADQLDTRLAEWMGMARPSSPSVKVAAMLGVAPAASDPGQPERLALNQSSSVRMAEAAPAVVPASPAPAVAAPVEPVSAPAPQVASAQTTVMDNPGFAVPVDAAPAAPALAETVEPQVPASVEQPSQIADLSQTLDSLRREPVRASGSLPLT